MRKKKRSTRIHFHSKLGVLCNSTYDPHPDNVTEEWSKVDCKLCLNRRTYEHDED